MRWWRRSLSKWAASATSQGHGRAITIDLGTAGAFSFAIARTSGAVVVTTHGPLDPGAAAALGDALLDLIDNQGNLAVVVDLTDLHVPDHTVLEALAPAASAAARRGGRLTLADPSEAVEWGLLLSGVAGLVAVTTPRRAAMALHPAGSGTTPTPVNPTTQGATQ